MDEAKKVLDITVQQQQELMTTDTLIKQRQQVLAHPGNLEALSSRSENKQIELLSLLKNRGKIDVTTCNIYVINKFNGSVGKAKIMPEYKATCIFNSLESRENQQKSISFFDG